MNLLLHFVCECVLVFYVHSGIEQRHEVYSCAQLTAEDTSKPEPELPIVEVPAAIIVEPPQVTVGPPQITIEPPRTSLPYPLPQPATAKIFAPRTEDMNKGFLMFSDDEPGLTSKLIKF